MDKANRSISITLPGTAWSAGWLFTIGYLQMSFWQDILAIVLWPYDLGTHFR